MPEPAVQPRVIDVRSIPKPQRHPLIFDAMEALQVGDSVVVKNDHNPIPLRGQVETLYGQQFEWHYLQEGPEVFRLQFTRRAPAPTDWKRPESKKNTLSAIALDDLTEAPQSSPDVSLLSTQESATAPVQVDLLTACRAASHSGPQWAHESEDLDLTLLSWEKGKRIEAHTNTEVDVVWIGIEGSGAVTINGEVHELRSGQALLISKGCERAVESTSERFSYLSVHRRRRGLMPTIGGKVVS